MSMDTLEDSVRLASVLGECEQVPLRFGTSGRRGLLRHISQLEIAINVLAELEFLQSLPVAQGGILRGDSFHFAHDLRPSSSRLSEDLPGRGELAQAVEWAIHQAGMIPVNMGQIPTPALACYALSHRKACIMVTGSHIPFDRNGYKTYTSRGELTKADEGPIGQYVAAVRARLYAMSCADSCFAANGQFKTGSRPLSAAQADAALAYQARYLGGFGSKALSGLSLLFYQHSAVGRDILVHILSALGAEVVTAGRSDSFVPIDTENMDRNRLATLQALYDQAAGERAFDAVVSTDGDSDRPLLLGVEPGTGRLHFINGDVLGMLTAEYLGADAVVVPISCNDAIDRGTLRERLEPKTRIGSPYVIAGMEAALNRGKQRVCGFEANGGFLTGSAITRGEHTLAALPTRDAALPLIAVLSAARQAGVSVLEHCQHLPQRHGHAALLADFRKSRGEALIRQFLPPDPHLREIRDLTTRPAGFDAQGAALVISAETQTWLAETKARLSELFSPAQGFGSLTSINVLDGIRLGFSNGDVAHVRPSGNADELRIYALANTPARAQDITAQAIAEPQGLLRRMADSVGV